jgi:hypothetical protein
MVDGAAARHPPEDGQAGIGRDLGPGVLVASDDEARSVDVEEEDGLGARAAAEEVFLEGEVAPGVGTGKASCGVGHPLGRY